MIFAANLKCNHTRDSFNEYAKILNENLKDENVLVFAPATTFLNEEFKFTLGAQNFYPCESGSYTGEIGKAMLDEFNIKTVLIGHSERREILGESEEFLRAKFDFAVKNGWRVVYCIGESLELFESGKTREWLDLQLANIDLGYKNLVIAYEPIWAIGTDKSASAEQVGEILEFIASKTSAPLLYGGSVNAKNIAEICKVKHCGGVLVGTASWDASNFLNLIASC
ncbi:triose-phosphate isomerase [Campylobacter sp. RM9344]|uniref:Triosephosphate isomerase n=1 Tax=Campylobacter californiensis TaxID=1032243 RepID=A0AAW3ZVK9_9BACT|nr:MULTISPECIES: triose-phosphate isomerase [unclassified Campylobacter]MBE2984436.1 triose-phosphate isomerase [Campylobacter sp. RM6883]MBE2995034.1 triose-phosphate isomerase [Campylobacter sp. RM6913]MBE3028875.1 triose-phosphate isomerase [Campylobacter sp. RM9344]MBE3607233.1 triose-phosphate isomerase [Campylobacter sp. RM9337]QCD50214.1 triosephosphate isomerase [Campylobacter sp. RM6914]